MILRLLAPDSDPSLLGGVVKEWHKAEGDLIRFGDEVCTIAFSEFAVLRRTSRASKLAGKRRNKVKGGLESREGKVLVDVVLTSSDTSFLQKILIQEGEPFRAGDTLAVVSTEEGPLEGSWDNTTPMRVIANMTSGQE